MTHNNETIIAQCTAQGNGALALLRLSGHSAFIITDSLSKLANSKKLSTQQTHTIHYGWVIDKAGTIIDQVLFLVMRAPKTFTGEDTVEITCHNNPFIIQNIIQCAIAAGARIAYNGEFSRRAVENKKIDMLQAEAINDLIHANTQLALKQSLSQLQGSFTHAITDLENKLIKALALSEASFEFIDEENMEFNLQIKDLIESVLTEVTKLKKTYNQQQHIRQGIRIAIIGSVNAGKSSLFNALLNKERAIVTNIAGTTRDTIEAGLYKNGNYWTLIDTAGIRSTNDIIEQMGIEKSYKEAQSADIILLVFDSSVSLNSSEQTIYNDLLKNYNNKIILIKNKIDLPQKNITFDTNVPSHESSDNNKTFITSIEGAIQEKIQHLFTSIESPFLLNQRHYNALLNLENNLLVIPPMLISNVSYELVSYHLHDAITTLSDLTGKTISERGMDAIFREFCVGK